MSSVPPKSKDLLLNYWPILSASIVIAFGVGGGWASYAATNARLDEVRDRVSHHQDAKNHPDNTRRVDLLTLRIETLERTSSEIRKDVSSIAQTQQRIILQNERLCGSIPSCRKIASDPR